MNILITNDDGWDYPGIKSLEKVAARFGQTWTVAPSKPMSGIGHQLTFERPLTLIEKSPRTFSLDGTPGDCVRIAMTQLGVEFDWVFSGINKGANLGADIYLSGTVAAVREASLFDCKGIAFSQHLRQFNAPFDWSNPASTAQELIPRLLDWPLEVGQWINVNIPDLPTGRRGSVKFVETQLDRKPLPADYTSMEDGRFLYSSVYNDRLRTPGCDTDVCFSGDVSITIH